MSKVLYEKRGEIAYIRLNRPDKGNAIDTETDNLLLMDRLPRRPGRAAGYPDRCW